MHRVLIVDDEAVIADTLGLIFSKHGFDAKVVYSAEDALQCAREFTPHLLLCDINMPGRSGWDLMSDFSQEFPDCRVLILTGYHSNHARVSEQSLKHRHPVRMLTKPCTPIDVLREVGQMLATA
ncbi:MAG TPA: response regulator [Acidobacteriaceae bacterium]|jgi:YesN/AraC family two-component response regulator